MNITCALVLKIFEFEHEELYEILNINILPALGQSLQEWLNKGKIKLDKDSVNKLKALTFATKSKCLSQDLMDFFTKKLFEISPKWKGQVQTEALNVLNSISNLTNYQVDPKSYKLISSIQGRDGRNIAAQLLWKSLNNPNKVRLNDNLLLNEEYTKLFIGKAS